MTIVWLGSDVVVGALDPAYNGLYQVDGLLISPLLNSGDSYDILGDFEDFQPVSAGPQTLQRFGFMKLAFNIIGSLDGIPELVGNPPARRLGVLVFNNLAYNYGRVFLNFVFQQFNNFILYMPGVLPQDSYTLRPSSSQTGAFPGTIERFITVASQPITGVSFFTEYNLQLSVEGRLIMCPQLDPDGNRFLVPSFYL